MKLTAKQTLAYKLALSGEKQFILFGGAIRGGKTYWLLLTFISLCSKYPKSRWCIVRASRPTLERTTMVTFNTLLAEGLRHYISSYDKASLVITFTNGSELIFMGENYDTDKDLDRFKGLEINGGGIDEINECQEATLYKMLERSGSWNNAEGRPPIVVLGTCNPANNWVKEKVYDQWMKGTLPETWAYIPSKITDNPHIPDDYLNSLKANMPEYEYLRFVEGDWEVQEKPENPFFTAFEPKEHEDKGAFFNPNLPILFAFDFNLQPFAGIVAHKWKDENGEHFHIVDEFSVPDGSIPKMIDTIKERYEPYLPMCQITGDAMGKRGDLSQRDNANYYEQLARGLKLSGKQIRVQDNPKHENSRAECNYILRHYPDFKVNPKSCPNTSRDLRMLKCDAMGTIVKRNRNIITQLADHGDCFAEGTMIATPFGSTPIQNIKIGYLVNTPNGQKRVLDAWNSVADIYEVTFSDGSVIFCTKDHKFYTDQRGYYPICSIFEENLLVWKTQLFTTEGSIGGIKSKSITTHHPKIRIQDACIDKYGLTTSEKYQAGCKSTTKTGMPLITLLKTLSWLILQLTLPITLLKETIKTRIFLRFFKKKGLKPPKNGTLVMKEKSGIGKMGKKEVLVHENMATRIAMNVENYIKKIALSLSFVPTHASLSFAESSGLITLTSRANPAERYFQSINIQNQSSAPHHAPQKVVGLSVSSIKFSHRGVVYDITVDEENCFYANGILVHNCVRYAFHTFLGEWYIYHLKKSGYKHIPYELY